MKIENYSWAKESKALPIPRLAHYVLDEEISVGGDAPKSTIIVYEDERAEVGVRYIAKLGHKWYPNESISEHLMTRIGECLGVRMARSKLLEINGQIRFCSQYFLDTKETLHHGAEIFATCMEGWDDMHLYILPDKTVLDWVHRVEKRQLSRTHFTYPFAVSCLRGLFREQAEQIIQAFTQMLFFDAIVGNNDRHFYNWGVIERFGPQEEKYLFSPIFDSARGLFWNLSDEAIREWTKLAQPILKGKIKKYTEGCKAKIGWDGLSEKANHFDLVKQIVQESLQHKGTLEKMLSEENHQSILQMIDSEFVNLMIPERLELIKECLSQRLEVLRKFVGENL